MRRIWIFFLPVMFYLIIGTAKGVLAQESKNVPNNAKAKKLTLVDASLCEKMRGGIPVNRSIVFSSSLGNIYCFTSFDPVPKEMAIYHKWFRRDRLRAKVKLTVKPPRWSTFSRMHIRKSDRGPWRVDVTDPTGRVLKILRFSITE